MRTITPMLLVGLMLLAGGCANSDIAGKWRGTITEQNEATMVEISLQPSENDIKGTMTILSNTPGDISTGTTYNLINVYRQDKQLNFVLSINGEIDASASRFNLIIENNRLTGYARQMMRGSRNIPVTFTR